MDMEGQMIPAEHGGISEPLRRVLEHHVVDLQPIKEGSGDRLKGLGNPLYGVDCCSVGRAHPPLEINKLAIRSGEMTVLIGNNGVGKSTLFDMLMETPGADLSTNSGDGCFMINTLNRPVLRVARLDQEELLGDIKDMTARQVLDQTVQYYLDQFPDEWPGMDWQRQEDFDRAMANKERQQRIKELQGKVAKLFDMEGFMDTRVEYLSGGERTKLSLFMVLSCEPDVFLADEPTNHLDIRSIAKLLGLFQVYSQSGAAVVASSHVDWFRQEVGKNGVFEITYQNGDRCLASHRSAYGDFTQNPNLARVPTISGKIEWGQVPPYDRKRGKTLVQGQKGLELADFAATPLKKITLPQIGGGDLVVMTGDNGTGKTILLDRFVKGTRGSPLTLEEEVRAAYLPQFWPEDIANGTLENFFEKIKASASPDSRGCVWNRDLDPKKAFIERLSALSFGGVKKIDAKWLNKNLNTFSGGEQRLLWFIAVSVLRDVDMLILDEPTNHMDREVAMQVQQAIENWDGAVVVATHDKNLLEAFSSMTEGTKPKKLICKHLVFTKKNGETAIAESREPIKEQIQKLYDEAIAAGRRVRIG